MIKKGRPPIQIDWVQFDKLCGIQATLEEIAGFLNVSPDTIERRCLQEKKVHFAEYWKQKASRGKISLRRKVWQKIEEGNTAILIFALKNVLGWSDKFESKENIDINASNPVINFGFQKKNEN
jgi:IS30 family transposase